MPKFMDLTGKRFNHLTVVSRAETKHGKTRWNCVCDCGNTTCTITNALTSGRTRSCGCFKEDKITHAPYKQGTHGLSGTHIYQIWMSMRKRCSNQNDKSYSRYGGRGIFVCKEWADSFETFYEWSMAHSYKDGFSIDRIDNNGNYCPENCRWVPMNEQVKNTRRNVRIEHNGVVKILNEWCKIYGIPFSRANQRYHYMKRRGEEITLEKLMYDGNFTIKKVNQYSLDGVLVRTWSKLTDVKQEGYGPSLVSDCCRGKRKRAYGFIWEYAQDSD